jgi:hypothetical protein
MGSFEMNVAGGSSTYCWGFHALGAHYIDNGFTADKVLLSASFATKSPDRSLRTPMNGRPHAVLKFRNAVI